MFLNFLALVNGRIKLQLTEIQKIIEGAIEGADGVKIRGSKCLLDIQVDRLNRQLGLYIGVQGKGLNT